MTGRTQRTRCPRCDAPVIRTPTGRLLEPDAHTLALHLPDGGQLTWQQAARIIAGHHPPAGHHAHAPGDYGCNPQPQPTLF